MWRSAITATYEMQVFFLAWSAFWIGSGYPAFVGVGLLSATFVVWFAAIVDCIAAIFRALLRRV